jgi:hypothetical protein
MTIRLLPMLVLLAAALVGCEGFLESPAAGRTGSERTPIGPGPGPGTPMEPPADLPECASASWEIFEGLEPHCAGCHVEGANLPFMASFGAFSSLLILDPRLVVPGSPDASRLIALLEGRAEGTFTQMPVGASSYADLEAAGATTLGISAIRSWIAELEPCSYESSTPPPLARRLRVHQMWESLRRQLGISESEYLSRPPYVAYPLYPPDEVDEPGRSDTRGSSRGRWIAMGGEDRLGAAEGSTEITPALIQHIYATSQAWCRYAVSKDENPALFRHGSKAVGSEDEATVRANIRHMFLQILGLEATEEDIDTIYREVFVPYEARDDARLGWIAVCSAMVRDPLWLTY